MKKWNEHERRALRIGLIEIGLAIAALVAIVIWVPRP